MTSDIDRQLYSGLLRIHVLHHAVQAPVFGFWIIGELSHHGYKVSPGVMYPLLRSMEHKGYLRSTHERSGRWARRVYRATPLGRKALGAAKVKVRELFSELFEDEIARRPTRRYRRHATGGKKPRRRTPGLHRRQRS